MSKLEIELDNEGMKEFLKSPELQACLEGYAKKIASKRNGNSKVFLAKTRAVARVDGDDGNNGLLKAMK